MSGACIRRAIGLYARGGNQSTKMLEQRVCVFLIAICSLAAAQDPASGWLGYAMGVHPNDSSAIITYIEATWRVPENPKVNGAFYSPWFGIESSDNLNLIQPVNPWSSNVWQIYNEYVRCMAR